MIKIFTELLENVSDSENFPDTMDKVGKAYLHGEYAPDKPIPFSDDFKKLWNPDYPKIQTFDIGSSENQGHFNHMCNVVGVMAHVINYAKSREVQYGTFDKERKIRLMLLAFYHDLGKTIISRRHAIEG